MIDICCTTATLARDKLALTSINTFLPLASARLDANSRELIHYRRWLRLGLTNILLNQYLIVIGFWPTISEEVVNHYVTDITSGKLSTNIFIDNPSLPLTSGDASIFSLD
jgi:hypothetical protein